MLGTASNDLTPFVGRADEVRLLGSLLGEVGTRGQSLLLRGEPGIGKSRLLAMAVHQARDLGMTVLTTSGIESEAHLPFGGLHQMFHPIRTRAAELPPSHRKALDAAFGLTEGAAYEPFRIAMAALYLISEVASDAEVLLVVEDVQWLDEPTAEVLAFLARRIESDPVLLLGALRDGYRTPFTVAGLPEHRLFPLDETAAAALLDVAAPDLHPAVRSRVLDDAGGNPLALLELPVAAGHELETPSPSGLALTERLERAFAGRISDLPEVTRQMLLVAALNDQDSVGEILCATRKLVGAPAGLDALEPAADASVVDLDLDYVRFRHPLIRSAVVQSTSLEQRRRAHVALATTLDGEPDRRVWHRAALVSGVDEGVACELEATGVRARQRGAIDIALRAFRRAVELSPPGLRLGRVFTAAELAHEQGRPEMAAAMMREIQGETLDERHLAHARFINELLHTNVLTDPERVAELIASAEQAGRAGDRELHHNLLLTVAVRTWWAGPSPEIRQLVIDAANRAGPPVPTDGRLVSLHAYADPYTNASRVIECLREAKRLRVTGTEDAGYLAAAGNFVGAFSDSLTFLHAAIESARAEGRLGVLPRLLSTQAALAVRLPDWDVAIPAADEAIRLATELDAPIWLATAETAVAMIGALRGNPDQTERATARAEEIARSIGASHLVALAQFGPILSALAQGQCGKALQLAERLFDPRDPAYNLHFACIIIADHAEAAVYSGDAALGRQRLRQVEVIAEGPPPEWVAINLRHARAVLADGELEAAERFQEALSADLEQWPFWRGRLLLAYGRWLRRTQRIGDSRAPLREAREIFDAIGTLSWGDHARSELRASGERSRRPVPEARDQLTPQELQIAQLAAEGLSNREIGERLFLSHRTVSTHLYRVFPKLGITSRTELSRALASNHGRASPRSYTSRP